MDTLISHTPIWAKLKTHQQYIANFHLRDLFALDSKRFENFSIEAEDFLLDYSKNYITHETRNLLLELANKVQLEEWINRLFSGEKVNNTEQRAALHIALRNRSNTPIKVDGKDVMPEINKVLVKMQQFTDKVRNGEWRGYTGKPIESIVNIGIGGSDLGPAMVTKALQGYHHPRLTAYFVSNVDATHLNNTLAALDPETTLFIIASKTFTTQETLLNAHSARSWLIKHLGDEKAVAKHFVAISTARQKVIEFGIDPINMFEFWNWVGGRYSLWSAIGLPIAVMIGMDKFEELLNGAHKLDQHFKNTELANNLPTLLALLEVWYSSFFGVSTQAILPYDYSLELFPAYLQQLAMESLGKRVTREGQNIDYSTCPIIWGSPGNNGQHAFYQLLHQGTQLIPADFIIAIDSQNDLNGHQNAVLSNALAQTHALMMGRSANQTQFEVNKLKQEAKNIEQLINQIPHRVFPGDQPSNSLVYQKLTPSILGKLIALYEHKVFVESVCWSLNPFDQWGVELGKQVANMLLPALSSQGDININLDSSTIGLLKYINTHRNKSQNN
jgi:glucose-6-phosphate isomerase